VVCLSVRLSVGHHREPCKSNLTDRDAVRGVGSGGPKEPCIRSSAPDPSCEGAILREWRRNFPARRQACSLNVWIFPHVVDQCSDLLAAEAVKCHIKFSKLETVSRVAAKPVTCAKPLMLHTEEKGKEGGRMR